MRFSTDETKGFSEIRQQFGDYVNAAIAGRETIVTKHGKPVAALVSAVDLYRYRELERVMALLVAAFAESESNASIVAGATSNRLANLIEEAKSLLVKASETERSADA